MLLVSKSLVLELLNVLKNCLLVSFSYVVCPIHKMFLLYINFVLLEEQIGNS